MKDNEKGLGFNTEAPMWHVRNGGQYWIGDSPSDGDIIATVMSKEGAIANAKSYFDPNEVSECEGIHSRTDRPADDTLVPMVSFFCLNDEDTDKEHQVSAMQTEIEIGSSHGQIFVFTDGTISRFETAEGEAEFGSAGIAISKFDLSFEALEDGFADILNVGYWHANGYEAALTAEEWEN